MAESMKGNPMRRYLHRPSSASSSTQKHAPYALVTGATGGMGEEWAYQLAKLGFNVIIQGRNQSKLEVVKETILGKFRCNVEVVLLVCEATVFPNEKLTSTLTNLIDSKDVSLTVVINNLGVQSEGYPILEEQTTENLAEIIVANAIFPAEVSRICLPKLKACQPSLLVTVTSIGAYTPTP
jgi:17beta-estradiol 17-dehydrogenase / very-long-chain 3-oxoacyl-CoA reductase